MKKQPPAPQQPPAKPAQLEFRFTVSRPLKVIKQPNGDILLRPGDFKTEGTVRDACRVLSGMSPQRVRLLIQLGEIKGWKPMGNHKRKDDRTANTRWKICMISVSEYREREEQAQAAGQ